MAGPGKTTRTLLKRLPLRAISLIVLVGISIGGGIALLQLGESTRRAEAATSTTTIEDTVRGTALHQFNLSGVWTRCAGCQPATANSSYHYTTRANDKATLQFSGNQVKIYGIKEKRGGKSTVSIDGGAAVIIDTYSATAMAGVIYTSPMLTTGNHTIVITNTNQKNASATGFTLSIDKAEVIKEVPPNATLYGKEGTFGNLGATLPSGQTLQTMPVSGWGFNAGQAGFFSALAPNGEVVWGTTPQTDNQAYPTADHMDIGVFNPIANTFRNLVVPTSVGAQTATNPFFAVGGASIETIQPVNVGGQQRLAFISMVPYHGWDTAQKGEYPSLGYLDVANGNLQYNQSLSKSAGQINAKGGLSAAACPPNTNLFDQQVAQCRGFAEMGLLPLSQKFIVTQYFPDTANGQQSGRLVVMGNDGTVAASYTYPNIPNGSGGYYTVNPREVVVDPTSSGTLEYFTVIFDVADNGAQDIFPMQEFAYNRSTNQIVPISAPVISGQKNATGKSYRFETAAYDTLGNLWATQAVAGSLEGGPMVVYSKISGVRKLEGSCKVPATWNGTGWKTVCTPDKTAGNTAAYGQTRSLTQDPSSKTMFAATLSGYLMRVKQTGSGSGLAVTTLSPINLGLDQLVDRSTHYIGVRKGVVDTAKRALYLPVVQNLNPADCPTWPGSTPCAPKTLDQWLYKFDLNAVAY